MAIQKVHRNGSPECCILERPGRIRTDREADATTSAPRVYFAHGDGTVIRQRASSLGGWIFI